MNLKRARGWSGAVGILLPLGLTLIFGTFVLLMAGANPLTAFGNILGGAFDSPRKWADVVVAMVPLLLCASGMLITFAAGLWNIGVEGQMIAGALMATWMIQLLPDGSPLSLPLAIVGGLVGGGLWGCLAGVLRAYGGVNEIFCGLGLNFMGAALTNYLIFGPWKPPDGATMSGTDPFPAAAWMPTIGNTRASLLSLVLALIAIAAVYVLLRDTHLGLRLKAIGLNERAAGNMGIDTRAHMLLALGVCGALAGLAGCVQATAVYHRLIPGISGGYGYLSQLVVLLSGLRAQVVPLVVFFFAAIQVGSPRLELRMQLDSSIGGVLQSSIVLFYLIVRGVRERLSVRRSEEANPHA